MADEAAGVLHPDAVQKLKEAAPATSGLHPLAQQAQQSTHAGSRAQHQPGEPPQVRSRCLSHPTAAHLAGAALHLMTVANVLLPPTLHLVMLLQQQILFSAWNGPEGGAECHQAMLLWQL